MSLRVFSLYLTLSLSVHSCAHLHVFQIYTAIDNADAYFFLQRKSFTTLRALQSKGSGGCYRGNNTQVIQCLSLCIRRETEAETDTGRGRETHRETQRDKHRETNTETETQTNRQTDRETDRQTDEENSNSNSKTLFYKDSSLGSVKNLTTSPC